MFEISEQEWAALCAADDRNFILLIKKDILYAYPDLEDNPTLSKNMLAAYDEARRLGIKSDARIVEFLWAAARYPYFWARHMIAEWLSATGMSADERFDLLLTVMKRKIDEFNLNAGTK